MSARVKLVYFFRAALDGIRGSPFVHVVAVLTLTLALTAYGAVRLGGRGLEGLLKSLGGRGELVAYLRGDPSQDAVERVRRVAARFGEARAVAPAEALTRLASSLGDKGEPLRHLGENPLPWRVEVAFPPKAGVDNDRLKQLERELSAMPEVEAVDYGEDAVQRFSLLGRTLQRGAFFAFGLIFATAVAVVAATLQLAIFSRREELEIQSLVGATPTFVRMPYLVEGALQGIFASILAVLLSFLAVTALGGEQFVGAPDLLRRIAVEQLALGLFLGLAGSFVAAWRFMRT